MATRAAFPPNTPGSNGVTIAGIDVDPRAVIVKVRGLKTGVVLDIKEGPGVNGGAITHQGRKLARWTLEFYAGHGGASEEFTPENGYSILMALAELAFNSGGAVITGQSSGGVDTRTRSATPIAIKQQMLAIAKVSAMVIEDIDWPEEQEDKSYVMTWSCIQYAPALKVNVTKPLQGDVLNDVPGNFSGAKGPAPASSASPQLPQPPPAPPSATKPKP